MLAWVVIDRTHSRQFLPKPSSLAFYVSALSSPTLSVQPLSFQPLTHYPSQRPLLNLFAINPLRTLFISTGVYPSVALPHDSDSIECLSLAPYLFYFQSRAHSFVLFCTRAKVNSFLFKRFRTLCKKTGGGGISAIRKFLRCSWKFSLVKVGNSLRSTARQSRVTSHQSPSSDRGEPKST